MCCETDAAALPSFCQDEWRAGNNRGGRLLKPAFWESIFALGLAIISPAFAQDTSDLSWVVYTSPRYGVTVEYPKTVFPRVTLPPSNSDGLIFGPNSDGATLTVFGAKVWEEIGSTPYAEARPGQTDCQEYHETYKVITAKLGLSTGYCDGMVFYGKCIVNLGGIEDLAIHCFAMSYPTARRQFYDGVLTRIGRSLH